MKTKKLLLILFPFFLLVLLVSCDSEVNRPLVTSSDIPPQVSNVKVENQHGAAKISYTLTNDPNILYVLATYTSSNGEFNQTKSSMYKNYVQVEGFSMSREYSVNLYTVSRSEIKSKPVTVKINPMDALVHNVFKSLDILPTFGGVSVRFRNPEGAEYVLRTLVKDSTDTWIEYDRLYTNAVERKYPIRGLNAVPTDFKFFFTDKWSNSSDTLSINMTPLFEKEFDKSLWKDAALADDSNIPQYGPLSQLWTQGDANYFFIKSDVPGLTIPNWFTIDLGKKYILGRVLVENVRHADPWMYARGTPEIFEIWGSNVRSTDWNDWTNLGQFTCIKPSGSPLGVLTAEDKAQIKQGDSYDFEPTDKSFRYIRFKTLKTFGNTLQVYLLELTFYGKEVE